MNSYAGAVVRTREYRPRLVRSQPGKWTIALTPPKPKPAPAPMSLQMFVARNGGLDPHYNQGMWRGELRMLCEQGKQGVMPGLFNRRSLKTFEEMAELCFEKGYLSEPDIDEMLYGLARDIEATLTGERRNRVYGHSGTDFAVNLAYEKWADNTYEEETA